MDNKILKEIAEDAAQKLNLAYGYCGLAMGPDNAMLNSEDRQGNDIKIVISVTPE
jgi:hypothetical protein